MERNALCFAAAITVAWSIHLKNQDRQDAIPNLTEQRDTHENIPAVATLLVWFHKSQVAFTPL